MKSGGTKFGQGGGIAKVGAGSVPVDGGPGTPRRRLVSAGADSLPGEPGGHA